MFKLFKEFYMVRNFPKDYPRYKKIMANIGFLFSRLIIHRRKNKLTFKDLFKANLILRKGDIVLCGEQETVLSGLIGDAVNHATIYVGRRRFIEAIGKGVVYVSFHKLFTEYNYLAILRTVKGTKRRIIKNAVKFAKSKLGRPYDYDFSKKGDTYFCSEIANDAYRAAGYKTGLSSLSTPGTIKRKIEEKISKAANALRPQRMIKGNFRVMFLSHNLELKKKKLFLKK